MGILIKGMEMPEFGALNTFVLPDGKVLGEVSGQAPLRLNILGTAIPVPTPHGRLIDADALKVSLVFAEKTAKWAVPALRAVLMVIDEMPTIIEAEEK